MEGTGNVKNENVPRMRDTRVSRAPFGSHALVIGPSAALGNDPVDDLVGIGDVAGLAMHAVRGIDFQPWLALLLGHLIDRCGTEILARIAVLAGATRGADIRLGHNQLARL